MLEQEYDRERAVLQTTLETICDGLGRATGFVQRASKVTSERFVQMLVLGCWQRAEVTLADMVAVGADLGVEVSTPGLSQRIDAEAVQLLQAVLGEAIRQPCAADGFDPGGAFRFFRAVYIEDSTYLSLPAHLAEHFRGSGGNASPAAVKVRLTYDYLSGAIPALALVAGRCPDQGAPLPPLPLSGGCLWLFDLGFFRLRRLAQIVAQHDYFLCRLQLQTALYTPAGERIDLWKTLRQAKGAQVEVAVLLGARQRLPVRLLCQRLPKAVVKQRRRRAQADAQRTGTPLSPQKRALLAWNLFCTNVPAAVWTLPQAMAAHRTRWQVELVFKCWKAHAGLDRFGNWRTERVLCQLYARLIALVLMHTLFQSVRSEAERELSWPKALRSLRHLLPRLFACIVHAWQGFAAWMATLAHRCHRHALKDKRRKDPSTYDYLCSLSA